MATAGSFHSLASRFPDLDLVLETPFAWLGWISRLKLAFLAWSCALQEIKAIHLRRYQLRRNALEIFLDDHTNYFFHFQVPSLCPDFE